MDNLIVLILFILASLISYISKQREMRRQASEYDAQDVDNEFDDDEAMVSRRYDEEHRHSVPAELEPLQTTRAEKRIEYISGKESSRDENTIQAARKIGATRHETKFQNLSDLVLQSSLRQDKRGVARTSYISTQPQPAMVKHRNNKVVVTIDSTSKDALRQGIVLREILDRPRCFDI